MNTKSNQAEKKQKQILYALIAALVFVAIGVSYLINDEEPIARVGASSADLPTDKVNPQDLWMNKIEAENKLISNQLKYIETLLLETKKLEQEKDSENQALKAELHQLKKELTTIVSNPQPFVAQEGRHYSSNNDDPYFDTTGNGELNIVRPVLTEITCESRKDKVFHIDRMIPSGTSVKAILVSSIDAPCSVLSHSDPQPVKLQILDDGHLPHGVKVKIKGGIIIASVYGELSNERVYMRLERLTQVKEGGEFIETSVAGYVTGEDGKFGVRGTVVDKSAQLVGNAALSGVFSGISDYLQAKAGAEWIGPYENGVFNASAGSGVAIQGGVSGSCSAFDMLTDYYIKRAEQIRPVIQITAGRVVDITFTHCAELGDLYTHNKVKKIREENRCDSF
jgi:conjugal transfer pilus assembly protein TraB